MLLQGPGQRTQVITRQPAVIELLTDQRNQLQRQAEELSQRRNVLVSQHRNMSDNPARRELETRMGEIDARLSRLDGQLDRLNEQINEAIQGGGGGGGNNAPVIVDVPRIVRGGQQVTIPPFDFGRQRGPDMRQIAGIMAAEAVALALIGVVVWRMGMRRMRASFERAFSNHSGQLNQLQQAVDVIGIEVERISEGQRYVAKVVSEGSPAARALVQQEREHR
jgi:hypothetical protein